MRVDLGSHRLHPSVEPRILAELRALLGADLQRRPRNGRIRLGGRWIAFPLRPLDLVRGLPPAMAAGAARDAALAFRRPPPREDTFEEVLRAALGPTLCERFYFPDARGARAQHQQVGRGQRLAATAAPAPVGQATVGAPLNSSATRAPGSRSGAPMMRARTVPLPFSETT